MKYVYFNGLKFTKDEETGYYLNSTIRKRLHVYVWEFYNGEIPKGYEVHHKNKDKATTNIEELELLSKSEHMKKHWQEKTEEERNEVKERFKKNVGEAAKKWHSSEKGIEWHKKHYERMKGVLHQRKLYSCKCCNKLFSGIKEGYCSNACKSKYRRDNGLDDIEKICPCCQKVFMANKYAKRVTCSKSCSNRYRSMRNGQDKKNQKDRL